MDSLALTLAATHVPRLESEDKEILKLIQVILGDNRVDQWLDGL